MVDQPGPSPTTAASPPLVPLRTPSTRGTATTAPVDVTPPPRLRLSGWRTSPRALPQHRDRRPTSTQGETTTTERILYYTGKTYKIGVGPRGHCGGHGPHGPGASAASRSPAPPPRRSGTTTRIQHHRHFGPRRLHRRGGALAARARRRRRRVRRCGRVEPQTETVWRQADKVRRPRMCFVNKLDRMGADYKAVGSIKDRLGANIAVLQIPIGYEGDFSGVVDLLKMKDDRGSGEERRKFDIVDIPADAAGQGRGSTGPSCSTPSARSTTTSGEVPRRRGDHRRRSQAGHPQGHHRQRLCPVLTGSAFKNKGSALLAATPCDFSRRRSTSRRSRGTPQGRRPVQRRADASEPFSALAFRSCDPHGKLTYFRVYSGTLNKGRPVLNSRTGQKERRAHPVDARQRGPRPGLRRRHRGRHRPRTPAPATPSPEKAPIILTHVPSGDPGGRSSPRPRQTRTRWAKAPRSLAGTLTAGEVRRGDRSDPHRRHGRGCTSRCSSTTCCWFNVTQPSGQVAYLRDHHPFPVDGPGYTHKEADG